MKLCLLGTGGALSGPNRDNTSFVVATDETTILVECSGNPARSMLRVGWDPLELDDLLISHQHPDHFYALPSLIHQLYIGSMPDGRRPLTVWGPEPALAIAETLLETVGLRRRDGLFEIVFRPLPLEPLESGSGDALMTTFPVNHNTTPTLGARFETSGGGAVVYSSDTQPCESVFERSRGAELLLHECSFMSETCMSGHTSLGDVERIVDESGARRIVLMHLPPMSSAEEERVRSDLSSRFGERVVLGHDGMRAVV